MCYSHLSNLLIHNSPLSDNVLNAFMGRSDTSSSAAFRNVIIPNSPVSADVIDNLTKWTNILPVAISNEILSAQGINPSYRTLTTINREKSAIINQRQLVLNNTVSNYIEDDSLSYAISLLENENTEETNKILLSYYLSNDDTTSVKQKMNIIPVNSDENIKLLALANIELDLKRGVKNEFDIDSTQEAAIREIADDCPATLATSYAQAILSLVYGEEFSLACDTNVTYNAKVQNPGNNTNTNNNDNYYLSQNIPNPFSDLSFINYKLPEKCSKAILNVYDISGRKLKQYSLSMNSKTIIINGADYAEGLYLYGLEIDGILKEYKKLIIFK